jgi:hypothetical protein
MIRLFGSDRLCPSYVVAHTSTVHALCSELLLNFFTSQAHVRLGKETIWCRVRKANKEVLKMHMM